MTRDEIDLLKKCIKENGRISASYMQRKLKITREAAEEILQKIKESSNNDVSEILETFLDDREICEKK